MRQLVLAAAVACLTAGSAAAAARDYFTEHSKDFGTTPRGPALTHYFAVKNTSQQPVTMGTARVSCGCVSASVQKSTLAPGETTYVVAIMDTRRIPQAGVTKTVFVYVPFLSPTLEEVSLTVSAIARDDLVVTPEALALGTVRKGKGGSATVKVTLFNNPNWQVTEATPTGIYIKPEFKQVARAGAEVAYEITATLKDDCPVGNWTADVWLKTNAPGLEKLRIPVTVNVVAPIAATPDAVSVTGKVGEASEQRLILQSSTAFKILQVKGTDDVVSVKTTSEEARPVHILTVAIKPTAAGELKRSLEILTDHKEQPSVTVAVKAMATK